MRPLNNTKLERKKKNVLYFDKVSNMIKLTLPHEEVNDFFVGSLPSDNSSARPQEQSLQAFLLPVVPQTRSEA